MTQLELTIDDLGAQGDGVAHYKNATIFVGGALSGERVRIEVEETKNVVKRGKLLDILEPSPCRIRPPCPHFPTCGGCRFQHMNDEAYTSHKLAQLERSLRQAGIRPPSFMPAVVTATETRRRARLAANNTKDGVKIGFNAWRSHDIVDMKQCTVLVPSLVALVQTLRDKLGYWLRQGQECDIQLTALDDGIDAVMIGGPALDLDARQNLALLADQLNIAHLSWRKWDRSPIEPIAHRRPLTLTFGTTRLSFPAGSFLQATKSGEQALIDFARNAAAPNIRALDLFCGLGGFGLSLENPSHVHFADIDGPAIEALERAIKGKACYSHSQRNLIGDVFSSAELNDYDLVIFDPPRGGAKAQAEQLARSDVSKIVSISCDPTSFARDSKILIEGGYKMASLLPVDQFLWSAHLELAAEFVK